MAGVASAAVMTAQDNAVAADNRILRMIPLAGFGSAFLFFEPGPKAGCAEPYDDAAS